MHLVNEEDHIAGLFHVLQHLFDSILKLATIFGTGHHAGQVQRQDLLIQQLLRHIAHDDLPSQSFGDGRLADAGLTDQAGIIFRAAGQNLDHSLDLLIPTNHRIQTSGTGVRRQITGEFPQVFALTAVLPGYIGFRTLVASHSRRAADFFHQGRIQRLRVHTGSAQNTDGHIVALPQNAGKQLFRIYIGIASTDGILHGDLHHSFGTGCQPLSRVAAGQAGTNAFFDNFNQQLGGKSRFFQNGMGSSAALPHQAQQQMLGSHVAVAQFTRRLLAQPQRFFCTRREFVFTHVLLPPFGDTPFHSFSASMVRI